MRYIEADEELAMRGKPLREAIEDDIKQGLVPFWVSHLSLALPLPRCFPVKINWTRGKTQLGAEWILWRAAAVSLCESLIR